jgi:hypothetical protein
LVTPPDDPFSAPLKTLEASRRVGLDSAYIAAQEALRIFKSLPTSSPKAFIYTGNTLNQIAIPGVLPFALPKVAAAMLIEYAANAYGKDGYRFVMPLQFTQPIVSIEFASMPNTEIFTSTDSTSVTSVN